MPDVSLHDPISGKYKFGFDSDYDEGASSVGYAFNEEEASVEWDYFAERQARHDMMEESDSEEELQPCKRLDIRCKGLPSNFRPQSSLDFLQNIVKRNVTSDLKHYIHTLRRVQQYMIPLVLSEFAFLSMGPTGAGKTSGYLIPLVNKLIELKEIELRGRKGPVALVVTHTENKIKHIKELCYRYSRGSSLAKYFTTKEDMEKDSSFNPNYVVDLICASAPVMVNVLCKYHVPLKWVKFLVIEEFHFCATNSEYMERLMALNNLLTAHGVAPVCMFISAIVPEEKMFDINFMMEMAKTRVVRLIAPPMLEELSVSVLPCKSTRDHCYWVLRLLAGEGVSPRKTVILVNKPRTAHFLTLLLTYQGISSTYITRTDSLLAAEDAIRQWRTEECRTIVADYDSLKDLDYGFVELCILFEPPDADFCSFHKRILDLSAKLHYRRRLYILLDTELDAGAASCVIEFLEKINQIVPRFLVDMAEAAGDPSRDLEETLSSSHSES
ncbi:DEAD/DEAH box helicase [Trichostrongylus colubriformis]|uniref:RNA helicase n=1 Tax=Trichostrongylus colubriformis TaxID=6319 RepID=A0AAN8F1U3_TRICO